MPAAYIEIIKYALGGPVAALATLRSSCELDEASRLGFFHEVVEPDKLLETAISYARCITPDCNTAYAMSKRALQDGVVRQIEERTVALDALLRWRERRAIGRLRIAADKKSCISGRQARSLRRVPCRPVADIGRLIINVACLGSKRTLVSKQKQC